MRELEELYAPLPVPAIVDADLAALLLKVESHVHRYGWDEPVHVRVVYEHDAHEGQVDRAFRRITPPEPQHAPVRHGRYTATTMFGPRVLYSIRGVPVYEQLRSIIMSFAYPPFDAPDYPKDLADGTRMLQNMVRMPGVVAFCVVGEAWLNTDRENLAAAVNNKVMLADVPGSVETRIVYCVDLADRAHRVQRIRGQKPTVDLAAPMRGDFTTSLRIAADAATGRTPSPEKFTERYPTLAEMLDLGEPTRMTETKKADRPEEP